MMQSSRVLVLLAVVALAAAAPPSTPSEPEKQPAPRPISSITDVNPSDGPWFSVPLFGNLFAPLWRLFPSFADIGPRIIADEGKFQVVVNAKDFKKSELKAKVKGGFLFVQGAHEATRHEHDIFASQFFHTYSLPPNCSAADVSAELSTDGYLVVTAPMGAPADRSKEPDREVPIKDGAAPFQSAGGDASTTLADDDRKEPTTPAPAATTDKDNNIYHGSETAPAL